MPRKNPIDFFINTGDLTTEDLYELKVILEFTKENESQIIKGLSSGEDEPSEEEHHAEHVLNTFIPRYMRRLDLLIMEDFSDQIDTVIEKYYLGRLDPSMIKTVLNNLIDEL